MKTYCFKPLLLCVMLVSAFLVSAHMDESLKQTKLELSVDLIDEGSIDEAIEVLAAVLT